MSARIGLIIAPILIAAAFAVIVPAQIKLDKVRAQTATDELRYLPSEHLLMNFTAGMHGIVADLLWIQCLQYTGRHYRGDRDFTWLHHMLTMTTRLDPYFVPAYRYGAIFLAMLKADDDAALNLLHAGMVKNPFAWELPYEAAMTWLLNRPENPLAGPRAAQYLAMAVETGNAPQFVAETAAALQTKNDMTDLERAMWENTRKSGNEMMRNLAKRKLVELDLRETCKILTQIVAEYKAQKGSFPKSLEDLLRAALIDSLPIDPLGGGFLIDSQGNVLNSTLLDAQLARQKSVIENALKQYQDQFGQWPDQLEQLADAGILQFVPSYPYPDQNWTYDPETGTVQ